MLAYVRSLLSLPPPESQSCAGPCMPSRVCRPVGQCWPSVRTLAEVAGIGKSTVSRHLAELTRTGMISRARRPAGSMSIRSRAGSCRRAPGCPTPTRCPSHVQQLSHRAGRKKSLKRRKSRKRAPRIRMPSLSDGNDRLGFLWTKFQGPAHWNPLMGTHDRMRQAAGHRRDLLVTMFDQTAQCQGSRSIWHRHRALKRQSAVTRAVVDGTDRPLCLTTCGGAIRPQVYSGTAPRGLLARLAIRAASKPSARWLTRYRGGHDR